MPTYIEFGQAAKAKWPGKYDAIPDDDVGRAVVAKFPQYQSLVTDTSEPEDPTRMQKIGRSAAEYGKSMYEAVRHPVETVKGMGAIASGAAEKIIPGEQKHEATFDAVTDFFKERYGSVDGIKRTLDEDPVGLLADLSFVLSAPAGLAKLGARAAGLTRTAAMAGKVAKTGAAIEPLSIATKGAGAVARGIGATGEKVAETVAGVTTSKGTEPFKHALDRPSAEFKAAMRGSTRDADLVTAMREAVAEIKQQRGDNYRVRLRGITKKNPDVNVTGVRADLDRSLEGFGVTRDPMTNELDFSRSPIADPTEQWKVKRLMEEVDTVTWGQRTAPAMELDTLKRRLGDFYSDTSDEANAAIARVKNTVAKTLEREVPGYLAMTQDYAKASELLDTMKKAFSLGDRAAVDSAVTKLSMAMRDDREFRRSLINIAQERSGLPIMDMIAGKQLSSFKPGGLVGRTIVGGGIGSALALRDPAMLGMLLMASPRVMGELFVAMGMTKQVAKKVMGTIGTVAPPAAARQAAFQSGRATRGDGPGRP